MLVVYLTLDFLQEVGHPSLELWKKVWAEMGIWETSLLRQKWKISQQVRSLRVERVIED